MPRGRRSSWNAICRKVQETDLAESLQRFMDIHMAKVWTTIGLLVVSNIFMTFAWYGHLKDLKDRPWLDAALVSWGIAFFEYMIQVPANRIGNEVMNLGQLKILQEVIALSVFVPFVLLYSKEKLTLDYRWASRCLLGAAFFVFGSKLMGG